MLIGTNIHTITGAKFIIETLKKLSVEKIFGYPGAAILDLYDELYKQADIEHILVRHEQSAVHAADGYARVSEKCGVVLVTSGPGVTNTVTGIVNAYSDCTPLVVLSGQVEKQFLGKNSFQEINICEMVKNCTKAVFQITDANDIESTLVRAFKIATEGKKGPVVIDMVKDIFSQEIDINDDLKINSGVETIQYNISDICRILAKIMNSKKPVIIAGGGVHHSKSYDELEEFAKNLNIPVVSTMMGLGAYPSDKDNYGGMIGSFGDNYANELVEQSDLIISLGCRFNDKITTAFKNTFNSKLIQIDINEKIISDISPSDYIIGDIKSVLKSLNQLLSTQSYTKFDTWLDKCSSDSKVYKKRSNLLHGFEVLQGLNNYTKDMNVIFTSDVGQHLIFAIKNLTLNKNRKILISGGTGTMGFGFPAAIGAAVANPDSCVVCITGDGSFQMSLSELAICKDLHLNIKVVILNNGYLGMVRQLQEKNCDCRYSQTKISAPDFVKLAQSYNLEAERVNTLADINKVFEKAFSKKETFILDFNIESMEIV